LFEQLCLARTFQTGTALRTILKHSCWVRWQSDIFCFLCYCWLVCVRMLVYVIFAQCILW